MRKKCFEVNKEIVTQKNYVLKLSVKGLISELLFSESWDRLVLWSMSFETLEIDLDCLVCSSFQEPTSRSVFVFINVVVTKKTLSSLEIEITTTRNLYLDFSKVKIKIGIFA